MSVKPQPRPRTVKETPADRTGSETITDADLGPTEGAKRPGEPELFDKVVEGGEGKGAVTDDDLIPDNKTELELENERAQAVQQEAYSKALNLRERSLAEMRARPGVTDINAIDQRARGVMSDTYESALIGKPAGYFVKSGFPVVQKGVRHEMVPGARIPDDVVTQLRKSGDLKRLIEGGCIKRLNPNPGFDD